jgi:hypothetical protein
MKRIFAALALASLFASVPAFAKSHVAKPVIKADTAKTDEAKPAEGGEKAKPKKSTKKSTKKTEETKKEAAPEAAPAK